MGMGRRKGWVVSCASAPTIALLLLDDYKGSIHKGRGWGGRRKGRKSTGNSRVWNKELKGESLGSVCRG